MSASVVACVAPDAALVAVVLVALGPGLVVLVGLVAAGLGAVGLVPVGLVLVGLT